LLSKEQQLNLSESILNCIEKAISPKFGGNVYDVIISNFEMKFTLSKNEIASHPLLFETLLDDIFGTGMASELIKSSIFRELAHNFQIFEADYFQKNMNKENVLSKAIEEIVKKAQ
jgi:hypothetical protein